MKFASTYFMDLITDDCKCSKRAQGRYNSFEFQISIFIAFCGMYMHGKYKKFLKDE